MNLATACAYWINCIVAYVFCGLSYFMVCGGLVSFVHLWPMTTDFSLRSFLLTGLLLNFIYLPLFNNKVSCGVLVSACLAAQLTALILHFFANWTTFDFDPLWPLAVFSFVLMIKLTVYDLISFPNFGLFKTKLSACAAVIGSLAQTMIGLEQHMFNNNCTVLVGALFSTCFIALNIKQFADQLPNVGRTIFHNYLFIAKQIVHEKISNRSLSLRIGLFLVAFVGLNPSIAFAASSELSALLIA